MKLLDKVYNIETYSVNATANSVEVFLPAVSVRGINCTGWFSTIRNNKGESEFNKRFILL